MRSNMWKQPVSVISVLLALLALSILVACGTVEVGIESEGTLEPAANPEGIIPASPEETPISAPSETASSEASSDNSALEVTPDLNPLVIAFAWSGEIKGECQGLHVNYGGQGAIGLCKQSSREWVPLDQRFSHATFWSYWVDRFAPFDAQAPSGLVVLQGLGQEEASPAWQRAMAVWGELVWTELTTDGRSESWTTALNWQQEMDGQPGHCQYLEVSTYGRARASFAPCDAEQAGGGQETWLTSEDWERFDAWYYSSAPLSDAGLDFYGIGPLEMKSEEVIEMGRWAEAVFNRLMLEDLIEGTAEAGTDSPTSVPATTPVPVTTPKPSPTTPAATRPFSFIVTPTEAEPGDTVILTWSASGVSATLCPSARYVLFTPDDCQDVPLSGSMRFTIPLEASGFSFINFLLNVEIPGATAPEVLQTTVALKCELTWFFSDEPQAGICPTEPIRSFAAAQRFERGTMIWLEQLGRYFILENTFLFAGEERKVIYYVSDPLDIIRDTSAEIQAPDGFYAPTSGFGLIWRGDVSNSPGHRENLGWALAPEFGYEAIYQCDNAIPSGGRTWESCFLKGPADEIITFHPLGGWYLHEDA